MAKFLIVAASLFCIIGAPSPMLSSAATSAAPTHGTITNCLICY